MFNAGLGYKAFLGLVEETVFGTAVDPRTKFVEINAGGDGIVKAVEKLMSASVYKVHQDTANVE